MEATNLKIARIRKGIPQWEFAAQIGIDATKLSKIENGRLESTEEIKKVCSKALKIPLKELFPENKR